MRTKSLTGRSWRLRTLVTGGAVLGTLAAGAGLAVGGSALTATAASADTCGPTSYFIPPGDNILLTATSGGLRYIVGADVSQTDPSPSGYAWSIYDDPGQSWLLNGSPFQISSSFPTPTSGFSVFIGFNGQTSQYQPAVAVSSCSWTVQGIAAPSAGDYYENTSGAPSGTNMAGYYGGMAQAEGIHSSADDNEGAGISADPGGDAGAGDGS